MHFQSVLTQFRQKLSIPLGDFGADDTDLCAIFANLLDNAVTTCLQEPEGARFLSVSARVRSQLKQVSTELRSAKAEAGRTVEPAEPAETARQRPARDWYEPEEPRTASPGIYQVERDGQAGYRISFLPCPEE